MTTLTFVDAQTTHSEQEAMSVLFVYKVDETSETQAIHVVGSEDSWGFDEGQQSDYRQTLFTGLIAYIKDYWDTYQALPDPQKPVNSQSDFPPYQQLKTAWEGYELILSA